MIIMWPVFSLGILGKEAQHKEIDLDRESERMGVKQQSTNMVLLAITDEILIIYNESSYLI